MNRRTEYILAAIAILIILASGMIGYLGNKDIKNAATYLSAVTIFVFFLYKLITGWLFINLTLKAEASREKDAGGGDDHLSVKVTLTKGSIDSLWLEDVEIRVSGISDNEAVVSEQIIRPLNFKKLELKNINTPHADYWTGTADSKYVMSTEEETVFSAYTRIRPGIAYSAEIVVVGERPFYSITRKKQTKIQWRASLVVLPK